jgi:hypothetical protein
MNSSLKRNLSLGMFLCVLIANPKVLGQEFSVKNKLLPVYLQPNKTVLCKLAASNPPSRAAHTSNRTLYREIQHTILENGQAWYLAAHPCGSDNAYYAWMPAANLVCLADCEKIPRPTIEPNRVKWITTEFSKPDTYTEYPQKLIYLGGGANIELWLGTDTVKQDHFSKFVRATYVWMSNHGSYFPKQVQINCLNGTYQEQLVPGEAPSEWQRPTYSVYQSGFYNLVSKACEQGYDKGI